MDVWCNKNGKEQEQKDKRNHKGSGDFEENTGKKTDCMGGEICREKIGGDGEAKRKAELEVDRLHKGGPQGKTRQRMVFTNVPSGGKLLKTDHT